MIESPMEQPNLSPEKRKKTLSEKENALLRLKNVLEINIADLADKIFAGAEHPGEEQKKDLAEKIGKVIEDFQKDTDLTLEEFQTILSSLEVEEKIKGSLEIAKEKFFISVSSSS